MKVEIEGFAVPGSLGHRNAQLQRMAVVILVRTEILLLFLPGCPAPGQCEKCSSLSQRAQGKWAGGSSCLPLWQGRG